jgi:hypothetical protein
LFPPYLLRQLATLPALHPRLRPLAPVVRLLAPWWRKLRPTKKKRRRRLLRPTPNKPQQISTGSKN